MKKNTEKNIIYVGSLSTEDEHDADDDDDDDEDDEDEWEEEGRCEYLEFLTNRWQADKDGFDLRA